MKDETVVIVQQKQGLGSNDWYCTRNGLPCEECKLMKVKSVVITNNGFKMLSRVQTGRMVHIKVILIPG